MFEFRQVPYLLDLSFFTCKMGLDFSFVCLSSFILVPVFYIRSFPWKSFMFVRYVGWGWLLSGELLKGVKRQGAQFFIEGNSNVSTCIVSWA